MFVDSGIVVGSSEEAPPHMKTIKEIKQKKLGRRINS